jgi:hypothetical protein
MAYTIADHLLCFMLQNSSWILRESDLQVRHLLWCMSSNPCCCVLIDLCAARRIILVPCFLCTALVAFHIDMGECRVLVMMWMNMTSCSFLLLLSCSMKFGVAISDRCWCASAVSIILFIRNCSTGNGLYILGVLWPLSPQIHQDIQCRHQASRYGRQVSCIHLRFPVPRWKYDLIILHFLPLLV